MSQKEREIVRRALGLSSELHLENYDLDPLSSEPHPEKIKNLLISRLLDSLTGKGYNFAFLDRPIIFPSTSLKEQRELSKSSADELRQKVKYLEKHLTDLDERIKRIEQHLKIDFEDKETALFFFKEMMSKIPEVKEIYYKETEDGFIFWTIVDSKDRFETLKKIVQVQIELDKKYKNLFFDFYTNHIKDVDQRELENWKRLY